MKANDKRGRIFNLCIDKMAEFDAGVVTYLEARAAHEQAQNERWARLCATLREIDALSDGVRVLGGSVPDLIEQEQFAAGMRKALADVGVIAPTPTAEPGA